MREIAGAETFLVACRSVQCGEVPAAGAAEWQPAKWFILDPSRPRRRSTPLARPVRSSRRGAAPGPGPTAAETPRQRRFGYTAPQLHRAS